MAGARRHLLEILIVIALVLLNGVFALSELAVVSSRRARLKALESRGVAGAATALELSADPSRFLSTVQIGITLVGIVAGAFSGAALGGMLSEYLMSRFGLPEGIAEPLGFGLVVALITYLSLVIGELVPKHLALRNPEGVACKVAPPMKALSRIAGPAVALLDLSTKAALRLLGQSTVRQSHVTEEEIKTVISEAETAGVLEQGERRMISGVLRLGDRTARGVMTPRTEVDWLDLTDTEGELVAKLTRTTHSRLPVSEGGTDAFIGVVQARELLATALAGKPLDVRSHVRTAPIVHENADALDILEVLQKAEVPMALVHDEYGHFEGTITPTDLLEAIAGAFRSDTSPTEEIAVERDDGSWLLAGYMPADEMADLLALPLPENPGYHTVAGFVLAQMQHLPRVGECVVVGGWRFEVVDLDGRRIDKVLVQRLSSLRRQAVG